MEENCITRIRFNLGPDNESLQGQVEFFTGGLQITADRIQKWIPMEGIQEFRCDVGVGSVALEASREDGDHLICRGTMDHLAVFSAASKRMNRFLDGAVPTEEWKQFKESICPKCHRPYLPDSEICPRCAKKGGYLRRLWKMAKSSRGYIYLSVLIFLAVAALNLVLPYLNRVLVDEYIKADRLPAASQYILAVLMILLVTFAVRLLGIARNFAQVRAGTKLIVTLRQTLFQKIEALSLSKISKRTAGELMNRVTQDSNQIQDFFTSDVGGLIEQVLTLLSLGIILFMYDWRLALMILLPTPLVMLSHRLMWRYLGPRYNKQWWCGSRLYEVLYDIFSGIRVVKAFGMEKKEVDRYDAVNLRETKVRVKNETYFAVISPVTNFLMGVGEFFLLYYVGNQILDGTMTLGAMQQFSAYVAMIYGPLRWLSFMPRRLARTMTSIVRVFDVLDETEDVADREDAVDQTIVGNIQLDNVSFGYEDAKDVLRKVNLEIQPGEMIGIVGRSGAGKSTLINLVMRMYDPDDGVIRIDGTDLRDITQQSLRSQIGAVLQETFLFTGTLLQNICYSKPDASYDEVITAAKLAGVHSFAVKLPDGYNTLVGERGHTLSGGERQRVAIARALLHNPKILILDEATASLDTETEKDIQDALQKLIAGRTTIAIAHRLSTLRNATRLVVLDHGRVAEVGTHDELLAREGLYYELVMAQRQMSKMPGKRELSGEMA